VLHTDWLGRAEGDDSVDGKSEGDDADSEETTASRDRRRLRETQTGAAQGTAQVQRGTESATQPRKTITQIGAEFVTG